MENQFLKDSGAQHPIICGAMYPCSNPELVAAASKSGGLGTIQPMSLTFVHGYDFREGIKKIRSITKKPLALNVIVERSIKIYEKRMQEWVDIALDEGVRFFVTALGDPQWVVDRVTPHAGIVYHDTTSRRHAEKALSRGVKGLICVNSHAGGHAGPVSFEELYAELKDLKVPLICAGGISNKQDYERAMSLGYSGIQMGTRFIATSECTAHESYKDAIVKATAEDIVLTTRVTGVPLAVINTPFLQKVGAEAGWLSKQLLKGRKTKHLMRLLYTLQSVLKLKSANFKKLSTKDFWQAGKSVENVDRVLSVDEVIQSFIR